MVLITHASWLCECVSAFFTQRLTDIVFFLWVYFSWGCGEKAHISYCISSVFDLQAYVTMFAASCASSLNYGKFTDVL